MNSPGDTSDTGLPGFRSWARVYVTVLGVLAIWVVGLSLLTWAYG
jgi:hypothetical protein